LVFVLLLSFVLVFVFLSWFSGRTFSFVVFVSA